MPSEPMLKPRRMRTVFVAALHKPRLKSVDLQVDF